MYVNLYSFQQIASFSAYMHPKFGDKPNIIIYSIVEFRPN